ncbi:MAG TPA: ATP-binding cassette domain-containing protein [Chthoniobacterales bacterium]|jgi:ABC-type Fe3+/spermidine/putrescine transport system ATPase subunit
MAGVRVERLRCSFTSDRPAVDDVSFTLETGEFFCLLGPSGCGKSTLLRLIGGYLPSEAGCVWLGEREVTTEPPERRNTGMVFQNYALFPHLSALDNVAFGLRVRGMGRAARQARAHEMLDWVGLTPDEHLRYASKLSGGQQQRVALARALATDPALLMLDEPFANLDRLLRERLREETKQFQRRTGTTTILVTHDREEAFALADRMAVMRAGRIVQTGTPSEIYERPANAFVAEFIGHRNLLAITRLENGEVEAGGIGLFSSASAQWNAAEKWAVGDYLLLRPERLRLHRHANDGCLPGIVLQTRFAGSHQIASLQIDGGATLEVHLPNEETSIARDTRIWLEVPAEAVTGVSGKDDLK